MRSRNSAPGSRFFGEPWPSGICDDGLQVATPVDELCAMCEEAIGENDQGSFIGGLEGRPEPAHKECLMRAVLGGIEHLSAGPHREGTCYEGSTLSYRQSALAAWDWVQSHGHPVPPATRA